MFMLIATEKIVHEWTPMNGEGNYSHSSSVDLEQDLEELTLQGIADGINEMIYIDNKQLIEAETIEDSIESVERISISIIEDGDGNSDPEGEYICTYEFRIVEIKNVDLSKIK